MSHIPLHQTKLYDFWILQSSVATV